MSSQLCHNKTLKALSFTLLYVHSPNMYCSIIISCATQSLLYKIVQLQKKVIRIITKSKSAPPLPILNSGMSSFFRVNSYTLLPEVGHVISKRNGVTLYRFSQAA